MEEERNPLGEDKDLLVEERALLEDKFSLCAALCVEPDEMWRYDGKVYRVHENRRQMLSEGEWHTCADEVRLMEILENPEGIKRSGKKLGVLRERLEELKAEIREIEKDLKEWNG